MTGVRILGTGSYLPNRVVKNEEFAEFLDTSDEWIRSHTGIEERRIAQDEPTWYMGGMAADRALENAGISASDIDMILVTTVTPDYSFPSMSCMIQNHIGNEKAFCFDIAAACAGFCYALDTAQRYLETGGAETILIVSSETLTQVTDFTDRASCILFGDGAGACVITKGDGKFGSHLGSSGAGAGAIYTKHARKKTPFFDRAPNDDKEPFEVYNHGYTVMDGHEVYRFATRTMPLAVQAACEKIGITTADLDLVIPHQANIRIIEGAAKRLKISMDKIYVNIQRFANTSSATIQIALDECMRSGRVKTGDTVCFVGFGSGLVYGACVLEV